MKSSILFRQIPRWLSVLLVIGAPQVAHAFPPAPHHVIFGMVRDDFGTPMTSSQVQVILETPTGTQLATKLVAFSGPGVNYQLEVPMDSGIAPDPYEPAALQIAARFKMVVVDP